MPVPSFLSNIADKAQAAVNSSPIAGRLPASIQNRAGIFNPATQPTANQDAAQGGIKNHALENIQHQFRSLQQQISNTSPIQKIITSEKGLVITFDSISRDSKAQSKELYTWGQSEADDLKDVTDRLAFLNFVQGSLAGALSIKLDSARGPFKALRDAEATLQRRRSTRASLQTQITKVENEKTGEKRLVELREQLYKHEQEDQQQERELELLKRKAVRESERVKWDAVREYGEKLVLLSQAATPIIDVLPAAPPTQAYPYTGTQTTAAVRVSVQHALDDYKTGNINLPPQMPGAGLSSADMRSFGETHASELSSLGVSQPTVAYSPPTSGALGASFPQYPASPPINPQTVNNSPASAMAVPSYTAPRSAGVPSTGIPPGYETPEDEKKRLEREEHERTLHAGGNAGSNPPAEQKPDDDDEWGF